MRPRTWWSTPTGSIWTGVDDGRIVRIPPDGGEPVVVADTGGRPLGLHVARDGRLLVCNSPGGLLALDPAAATFETLVAEVDGRPLRFCSNVTELPDGTIYFTESTSAFTYAHFLGADLRGARPRQPVPSRPRRHRAHAWSPGCTSPTA